MDKAVLEIGLVDVMRHSIRCATHPRRVKSISKLFCIADLIRRGFI